jgi:hypothetical protein
MDRAKWLPLRFILLLCTLAAGIGIGLALAHVGKLRGTTEFFRRLADEAAPDMSGYTDHVVLARRLRKKNFAVEVVRSAPRDTNSAGYLPGTMAAEFAVFIILEGPPRSSRPPGKHSSLRSKSTLRRLRARRNQKA